MKLQLILLVTCCLATAFGQDEPEEPPPEPPNPCDGLSGVFVNDPTSCAGYYLCVNSQGIPGRCEAGFFFNEAEQLCDFEANVACVDCPPTGVHFIPVPKSCTQFFLCFNGVSIEQECAEGLYFDSTTESCDVRQNVDCPYSLCPINAPGLIFIPSVEDCGIYYICSNGEPIQQACETGLFFNPDTNKCDLPENVDCDLEGGPGPDPPLPGEPADCPADDPEISFIPHPTLCTHYFVCLNGDSMKLECAPGLIFDSVNLECNVPEIAVCGDDPDPPEPPPEERL